MIVRSAGRFNREDFPEEQQEMMEQIGEYLNTFNEDMYECVNKNITITDNLNQEIKQVDIKTDENGTFTQTIIKPSVYTVQGVLVIKILLLEGTQVSSAPFVLWTMNTDGNIVIDSVTGLNPSSNYRLTLLFITN